MSPSRNWFPFKRWLRSQLLAFIDRYLDVPTEPKKYRAMDAPPSHHQRARGLKDCLANKISQQSTNPSNRP